MAVRAAAFVILGAAFVAVADLVTSYVDAPYMVSCVSTAQLVARTLW